MSAHLYYAYWVPTAITPNRSNDLTSAPQEDGEPNIISRENSVICVITRRTTLYVVYETLRPRRLPSWEPPRRVAPQSSVYYVLCVVNKWFDCVACDVARTATLCCFLSTRSHSSAIVTRDGFHSHFINIVPPRFTLLWLVKHRKLC